MPKNIVQSIVYKLLGLNREILRLAVPNIISNISIPLLSSVDTALMGQLSAIHLGAVGICAMLFNFIYWNFGFLRMGTTGMVAQSFGAQQFEEIAKCFFRGISIAIILSIIILFFRNQFLTYGSDLLNVSSEHNRFVAEYYQIRIVGAPATLLMYVFLGVLFGLQNAMYPLIITVVVNVLNIIISYTLVTQYGMEISGVALGTILAEYLGLMVAGFLIFYKYRNIFSWRVGVKAITTEFSAWLSFLKINSDLFLRTVCLTFAFGYFYSQSSAQGAIILASNIIMLQFLSWMSYGIDGFAYASESLVGKYYGAADKKWLSKAINLSFIWGGAVAAFYSIMFFFFADTIATIFSSDQAVIDTTINNSLLLVVLPIVGFMAYIWDGVFIGLTTSRAMLFTMLSALIFYIFVDHYLYGLYTNSIWISFIIFLFSRGLFQTLIWHHSLKRKYL